MAKTTKKLNTKVLTELRAYKKRLAQAGVATDQLIVFGSYAKGVNKPWSDIDLCVVSRQFGKNRHDERIRLLRLTDNQTVDIEPHPYHPRDLQNRWDPLAQEITKYGITITTS